MRWNLFCEPLGSSVSNVFAPKKEMPVPLAVPIATAAASVMSSLFGGSASQEAAEEAERRLERERLKTEAERRRAKNETWLSTASGQNTLRMLRDEADRAWKRTSGAAAVGGATDAAVAKEKELQNLKQAEVIAQANAAHEDKKESVDASYRQQLSSLAQQQIGIDQSKAQARAQVAGNVSSALMQGAMATFGGTKLGQSLMGAGASTVPSQLQQMGGNYKVLNPYIQRWLQDLEDSKRLGFQVTTT